MKLNKRQIEIVLNMGCEMRDIPQIEEAIKKTVYTVSNCGDPEQKISKKKAIELLGEKVFFSGICRSAFHWTCEREFKNNCYVGFDSSQLFK